jgi:hypothetical protein
MDLSPLQDSLPDTLDWLSIDNNPSADFSPLRNALPKSLLHLQVGTSHDGFLDDDPPWNLFVSVGCNDLNESFNLHWGADWDEYAVVKRNFNLLYTHTRRLLLFVFAREVQRFGTRSHVKRLPVDLIRELRHFVKLRFVIF